jgi:hypothetical protein
VAQQSVVQPTASPEQVALALPVGYLEQVRELLLAFLCRPGDDWQATKPAALQASRRAELLPVSGDLARFQRAASLRVTAWRELLGCGQSAIDSC